MPFKKGQSGNPAGRPINAYADELRALVGKDAKRYVNLIKRVIDGKKKTDFVTTEGKVVKVPLPLDKRVGFAFKLLNKIMPDLKAQEISGDINLNKELLDAIFASLPPDFAKEVRREIDKILAE